MIKFIVFILLFMTSAFADQDRELLKISTPKLIGIHKKEFYADQLTKMSQRIIWESTKYQIVMSNSKTETLGLKKLSLTIKNEDGINSINFVIHDEQNRVMSKAWAVAIPDRFLLLQARLSLYEVLLGKQKLKKALKKVVKDLQNEEEDREKTKKPDSNSAHDALSVTIKALLSSAGISTQISTKPFSAATSLTDTISYEDALTTVKENIKAKKKKSKRASEFSIDLKQMKIAIAIAIKTTAEEKKKKKENSDKETNEDQKDETESHFTSKTEELPLSKPFNKGMRTRKNRSIIHTAYLNINSSTNYLVATTNNFNFLGINYQYRKALSKSEGHDFVTTLQYYKSIGSKAEQFDVPDILNLYLQYLYAPSWLPFDLFIGVHYENQPFINLPVINEGLKSGENTLVWSQIGVERVFYINQKRLILNLSYFKSILADSSYETDNTDASKIFALIEYDLTSKYRIGLGGFKTTFTSSKLEIDQNVFLITLNYTM